MIDYFQNIGALGPKGSHNGYASVRNPRAPGKMKKCLQSQTESPEVNSASVIKGRVTKFWLSYEPWWWIHKRSTNPGATAVFSFPDIRA